MAPGQRAWALSFGEATSPRVLEMYCGDLESGDASLLVLKFPTVAEAAGWASATHLENESHVHQGKGGPSFADWCYVEVMTPDPLP